LTISRLSLSGDAESPGPDPDLDNDSWMPREVAIRFGEIEDGYAAIPSRDWEEAEFVYPAGQREEIEQSLRRLGFTIVHDNLIWCYLAGQSPACRL
jgi:hypothetical protein